MIASSAVMAGHQRTSRLVELQRSFQERLTLERQRKLEAIENARHLLSRERRRTMQPVSSLYRPSEGGTRKSFGSPRRYTEPDRSDYARRGPGGTTATPPRPRALESAVEPDRHTSLPPLERGSGSAGSGTARVTSAKNSRYATYSRTRPMSAEVEDQPENDSPAPGPSREPVPRSQQSFANNRRTSAPSTTATETARSPAPPSVDRKSKASKSSSKWERLEAERRARDEERRQQMEARKAKRDEIHAQRLAEKEQREAELSEERDRQEGAQSHAGGEHDADEDAHVTQSVQSMGEAVVLDDTRHVQRLEADTATMSHESDMRTFAAPLEDRATTFTAAVHGFGSDGGEEHESPLLARARPTYVQTSPTFAQLPTVSPTWPGQEGEDSADLAPFVDPDVPPVKAPREIAAPTHTPKPPAKPRSGNVRTRSGKATAVAAPSTPDIAHPPQARSPTSPDDRLVAAVASPSGGVGDYALAAQSPDAGPSGPISLAPCGVCGRKFATERLAKHETVCAKAASKKRKTFDMTKARVAGTEAAQFLRKGRTDDSRYEAAARKKANWRAKSEAFQAAMKAARSTNDPNAAPPPPSDTSHLVPCDFCGRKFNETAHERHVVRCREISQQPKVVPKGRVTKKYDPRTRK